MDTLQQPECPHLHYELVKYVHSLLLWHNLPKQIPGIGKTAQKDHPPIHPEELHPDREPTEWWL